MTREEAVWTLQEAVDEAFGAGIEIITRDGGEAIEMAIEALQERVKNCPSCGGTLNDDGRCPYCNSKVYDLSDITIDPNSHDIIKLKIKCGEGKYFIVDCYPANVMWEQHSEPMSYRNESGALYFHNYVESRFTLELVALNGR